MDVPDARPDPKRTNHLLAQFSREFLQLYPLAKVLVTTKDLTGPTGRKTFISWCATGDWDAVVITYSAFERLALRASTYQAYSDEALADLRANLDAAKAAGTSDQTVKQRGAAVARAEEKLKALLATAAEDDGVCFEESGVDYLLVDFTSRRGCVGHVRRGGRYPLWRTPCGLCSPRSLAGAWSRERGVGVAGWSSGPAGEPCRRAPVVRGPGRHCGVRASSC